MTSHQLAAERSIEVRRARRTVLGDARGNRDAIADLIGDPPDELRSVQAHVLLDRVMQGDTRDKRARVAMLNPLAAANGVNLLAVVGDLCVRERLWLIEQLPDLLADRRSYRCADGLHRVGRGAA